MRAAQFLAVIGRGSKGSNALENTEDRAGATSEQQDNVINTVNSLDPYGPSWQLVPGNVAAGTVYAQVPTSGTGDLTFTRASTATRTNSAGNIVDVASGVGRIHYRNADGSISPTGRLLLEPQRTNSIRNSTMVGAVAGSPGTLPTNWGEIVRGLTRSITGVGVVNGINYIDLRFNGTATGGQDIGLDGLTAPIVAALGQSWSLSSFVSLQSGTIPSAVLRQVERTAAGAFLTDGTQAISLTSTLQRFSYTRTTTNASIERITPLITINTVNGATYDFTIRIAAPQMELGTYATTFIRTTTAAVTRVADTALKTGVADLIGQTEGTLFFDCEAISTGANQSFSISDGTTSQRIDIRLTSNAFQSVGSFSGSAELNITGGSFTNGQRVKLALAYANNDAVLYANGALIGSDSTFTVVGTFNRIGFDVAAGTQRFNSPVAQAALFPTRLTNAQLAAITTL